MEKTFTLILTEEEMLAIIGALSIAVKEFDRGKEHKPLLGRLCAQYVEERVQTDENR